MGELFLKKFENIHKVEFGSSESKVCYILNFAAVLTNIEDEKETENKSASFCQQIYI